MNPDELVRRSKLAEIVTIANELNRLEIVDELIGNLQKSFAEFKAQSQAWLQDPQLLDRKLHILKNQFGNLGCDQVALSLNEVYIKVREGPLNVPALQAQFRHIEKTGDSSLLRLRELYAGLLHLVRENSQEAPPAEGS